MGFFNLNLAELIVRLIVLFVGLPIHEWAHAWSAYQLGDDTARLQGRLTLNPFAHLDLFGSLVLLLTGFGWAKPVPVNPYRLRGSMRVSAALTAAAGPLSNFVMALLLAIPFRMGWLSSASTWVLTLSQFLYIGIGINIGLMLFNLVPIPPLDGFTVLVGVLPPHWSDRLLRLRPYGPLVLIVVLLLAPYVLSPISVLLQMLLLYV